jgi:hypothetical protein
VNKKWFPYLLILALAIAVFVIKKCKQEDSATGSKGKDPVAEVNRNRGFDRRASYIEYTRHSKCRMGCRHISQAEVEEIMQDGKINYNKSNVKAKPCPTYALEGITKDEQRIRIVFAQCDFKSKVVTVIDLNTDWNCDCPGDDDGSSGSPHKNRN